MKAIINANILTPEGFREGHSLVFHKDRFTHICPDPERSQNIAVEFDAKGQRVLPGFIDVQVNGGGGVLFNDSPTVESIKAIGAAHRQFGTTGFLPTLISDKPDVMAKAIAAVDRAIEEGVPGVLGIHLEGPYLNEARKGVHDAQKFAQIGEDEIRLLCSLKAGKTLVTLAPEMTHPETVRKLTQRGVIVAAGHTEADYGQTISALDCGLTGFTHLFNAMTPLQSRAPGIIAAALEDHRAWCGIIADGHHVHPAMLRLALRAKTEDQIFLVTDAMPSVGARNKGFVLGNYEISVSGGKCVTANGTLAGSDLDMMSAVLNAEKMLGVDLPSAIKMASSIPAKFLGLDGHGSIKIGASADFILVDEDNAVIESWIEGQPTST